MGEKYIKNFPDNFKLLDIITLWLQQIKHFCNNTKGYGSIY